MKEGWDYKKLDEVCYVEYGTRVVQKKDGGTIYPVYGGGGETFRMDRFNRSDSIVIARFAMSKQCTRFVKGKFFLNDSGLTIRSKVDKIAQDFLNWHIIALNDEIYLLGKGMAQKNLDMPSFRKITLKIPPLSEQQHIVEELDLLSSIIEKKKAQLNELDNLAQSLFYEMFGDPITNEKGWEVKTMNEVCNEIGDGLHGTPQYDPNGSIAFINGNNLIDGKITITDRTQYVNETEAKKIFIKMDSNTVLLSINGTLGKTAIYNNENVVLGKSACYLRLSNQLTAFYVMALMNTHTFKDFLESNSSKSTIKNVGLKAIRNYKVILPSLALQQQFASKIEAIEHQKELIKQSIKEVETLFNSRMDYYFN